MSDKKPCPNCKEEIAAAAVICVKCGFDLRTGVMSETQFGMSKEDFGIEEGDGPPPLPTESPNAETAKDEGGTEAVSEEDDAEAPQIYVMLWSEVFRRYALKLIILALFVYFVFDGYAWFANLRAHRALRKGDVELAIRRYKIPALIPGSEAAYRKAYVERSQYDTGDGAKGKMFCRVRSGIWGRKDSYSFNPTDIYLQFTVVNQGNEDIHLTGNRFMVIAADGSRCWGLNRYGELSLGPNQGVELALMFPRLEDKPKDLVYFDGNVFLRQEIRLITHVGMRRFPEVPQFDTVKRLSVQQIARLTEPKAKPASPKAAAKEPVKPGADPAVAAAAAKAAEEAEKRNEKTRAAAYELIDFVLYLDPGNEQALLHKARLIRGLPSAAPAEAVALESLKALLQEEALEAGRERARLYQLMVLKYIDSDDADALIALANWPDFNTEKGTVKALLVAQAGGVAPTLTGKSALRPKPVHIGDLNKVPNSGVIWESNSALPAYLSGGRFRVDLRADPWQTSYKKPVVDNVRPGHTVEFRNGRRRFYLSMSSDKRIIRIADHRRHSRGQVSTYTLNPRVANRFDGHYSKSETIQPLEGHITVTPQ